MLRANISSSNDFNSFNLFWLFRFSSAVIVYVYKFRRIRYFVYFVYLRLKYRHSRANVNFEFARCESRSVQFSYALRYGKGYSGLPEGRERSRRATRRWRRILFRMQFSSDNRGAIYRVNRFLDVYVLRTNYTMPSRAMLSAWFAG